MIKLPVLAALLALLAVPALAARDANFDPFGLAGIDERPDAEIPLDLPFRNADGETVTLAELADGKPIVLVPVLHNCPNICGVTLSGVMQAIRAQEFRPGEDFTMIAFGIDPEEGPEVARADLAVLQKSFPDIDMTGIHATTGTTENIRAVTDALGYRYAYDERISQYAHVAATAFLTRNGHLSRWIYGLTPQPTDMKLALTEAGEGQIGDWGDQILLLCYHYDPVTGRYGSLVQSMLRIGGGLTALAGGGLIAVALMRERRKRKEAAE